MRASDDHVYYYTRLARLLYSAIIELCRAFRVFSRCHTFDIMARGDIYYFRYYPDMLQHDRLPADRAPLRHARGIRRHATLHTPFSLMPLSLRLRHFFTLPPFIDFISPLPLFLRISSDDA